MMGFAHHAPLMIAGGWLSLRWPRAGGPRRAGSAGPGGSWASPGLVFFWSDGFASSFDCVAQLVGVEPPAASHGSEAKPHSFGEPLDHRSSPGNADRLNISVTEKLLPVWRFNAAAGAAVRSGISPRAAHRNTISKLASRTWGCAASPRMASRSIFNSAPTIPRNDRDLQSRSGPTAARSTTLASDPGRRPRPFPRPCESAGRFLPSERLRARAAGRSAHRHRARTLPFSSRELPGCGPLERRGDPDHRQHPVDQRLANVGRRRQVDADPLLDTHWRRPSAKVPKP